MKLEAMLGAVHQALTDGDAVAAAQHLAGVGALLQGPMPEADRQRLMALHLSCVALLELTMVAWTRKAQSSNSARHAASAYAMVELGA